MTVLLCSATRLASATAACLAVCSIAADPRLSAAAQTVTATTGAINGVVTDGTKAVLPGVAVSLSGPALMTSRTVISDETGGYRFSAVPTGDYAVTFELPGFETSVRDGIHVGLGFTATVSVELHAGRVSDTVTVNGSPVVDVSSTRVTTHFDSEKLASLPGARDVFALLANTPGVAMSKMDVGGNNALSLLEYTAYGLRAATGVNRNEVEGIRVGGANGSNDNYLPDFASFSEIAITAVGHTASMPVPGTLGQYVSKSGGNAYHGGIYADFQNEAWEATNIDDDQIARGVAGGPGLDVRDVNRLQQFRDFNADLGGYLRKDKAWWYAAYRSTAVEQQSAWLLDAPGALTAVVGTGKVTYLLSPRQKLVGYVQHQVFEQPSFFAFGASQPIQTSDALPHNRFLATVWKTEYNAAVSDALFVEVRVGSYHADTALTSKSTAPRIADVGANTVSGGTLAFGRIINRPQVNGSLSFQKTGWGGSHTLRIGGEYMLDKVVSPTNGYDNPCNCVSTLNNGVPVQVQILLGPNVSKNNLATSAAFVDDTWRLNRAVTLSLGVRLDRYQPILPDQEGPTGQTFPAIDPVLTFSNWGPRVGMSTDLTGDGKTVLKLQYGRFWVYPAPIFTAAVNPNASGWSQTYLWTSDANANGRWDRGEEGRLIAVSGGSSTTRLDPDISNTSVDQGSAYLEREVAPNVALRTGVVLNARRQPYGTINVSRLLAAYSVPVAIVDPGPDGQLGSADDGGTLNAYNLSAAALSAAPVNLTTNLPDSNSEYYTWEITATKRQTGRWSLLASFTETWSHEAALGTGNDFTPNALINASGTQVRFKTWQAKLNGTVNLPWGLRVVPVMRHQSGQPFARTFVQVLNYGSATIKAEPITASRTPDITLLDVRTEKVFRINTVRLTGFFDVYNLLNTNAEQTLSTSSGGSWLRPTAITGPRILRIGARLDW
ncbi:MAG TPA: carboxypeptidase regulatory-like domain-containing protein [Vicinamibacterales bacterium]